MFSIVYPDSDNELRPVQERRVLYLDLADYERFRSSEVALAYVAFRFLKCPLISRPVYKSSPPGRKNGRSLSEPLHVHIVRQGRPGSRSGSDRAVRRKPVVRSGQDVLTMGFQSY
jgi:hypothetical protein